MNCEFHINSSISDLVSFYNENGYLIVRQFFDERRIDEVNNEVKFAVSEGRKQFSRVNVDVLGGALVGRRVLLKNLSDSDFQVPVKINNLYQESEIILNMCRDKNLLDIVDNLLGGDAIVVNSLNLVLGSQQSVHNDSWYIPAPNHGNMAAAFVYLEDSDESCGPLFIYPGSHRLNPFMLPNGRRAVPRRGDDPKPVREYAIKQAQENKLEKKIFTGRKGDLLIWHGEVLHGGMPILDKSKTRRSLVAHYWRSQDVPNNKIAFEQGTPLYLIRRKRVARIAAKSPLLRRFRTWRRERNKTKCRRREAR